MMRKDVSAPLPRYAMPRHARRTRCARVLLVHATLRAERIVEFGGDSEIRFKIGATSSRDLSARCVRLADWHQLGAKI